MASLDLMAFLVNSERTFSATISLILCQSVSLKPHSKECGQHFEHKKFVHNDKLLCRNFSSRRNFLHPKIEHLFKPLTLVSGGASIF